MKTTFSCQIGPEAPEWLRILPLGEVVLGDGREPFQVTQESLEKVMKAWKLRGNDMVIDYEHQTGSGREAPAAGWVKALGPRSDGLYAKVEWTSRGREKIEKKEYRYFSPVVRLEEGRVVVDVLHVALTNFPAISRLAPLVLHEQRPVVGNQGAEFERPGKNQQEKEKVTGGKSFESRGENMIAEELRLIFGLQGDAPESQILNLAAELVKNKKQQSSALPPEIIRSLSLEEDDTPAKARQCIESLKAEVEKAAVIKEELSALKREQKMKEAERLIQEALSSKRTSPAELDLANYRLRSLAQDDPDFFRELILSRPENWAVPGPLGESVKPVQALTHEEGTICQTFGITPEEFMKHKARLERGE